VPQVAPACPHKGPKEPQKLTKMDKVEVKREATETT